MGAIHTVSADSAKHAGSVPSAIDLGQKGREVAVRPFDDRGAIGVEPHLKHVGGAPDERSSRCQS